MREIVILMRPLQWAKNLFIYLPLFFAHQFDNINLLVKTSIAFVLFSLLCSGIYIFNDYHDKEEDRSHKIKKNRPLAAGSITEIKALKAGMLLISAALIGAWLLNPSMFWLALIYLIMNIVYTIKIKHVPLLDIYVIAIGFVIRIFVGGAVTDVKIYPWIITMTFLLALFLALGKRRDDVLHFLNSGKKVRQSVEGYTINFIDNSMMMMAAITVVSYLMYTMSAEIMSKYKTDHLYLTTVFVILGIMRYLQITMVKQSGIDPTEILIKDLFMKIVIVGWISMFGILIYL